MITINIVAVGKIKEKYFADAINEYAKRLGRFCKFNIIEVSESSITPKSEKDITKIKSEEGRNILSKLKGMIIVLDIGAKEYSSEGFSEVISHAASSGVSTINFVIGGSHGLNDELKNAANISVSFGKMTLPHQLMRVVLTEQLYRAFTIIEGSAYHK